MKAIFIDSENEVVSTVNIDKEQSLKAYYKLIQCKCVTVVSINDVFTHSLYLDDDALYSDKQKAFTILGQRFIGNGVIVGFDEAEGDDTDTRMTENYVRDLVIFCQREEDDQPRIEFYSFDDLMQILKVKNN